MQFHCFSLPRIFVFVFVKSYEDAESSLEADVSFGKDILQAAEKVHSSYRSQKHSMVCNEMEFMGTFLQ